MGLEGKNRAPHIKTGNQGTRPDLKERVYLYALAIIEFIGKLKKNDSVSRVIREQLIDSGTSVAANVVEAQSASSRKDFINFYNHSLKSANESTFWISLLRDSNRADERDAEHVLRETKEIANILAASILTMKGKRKF